MKRTRRGLIACAVLVAVGLGVWLGVRNRGPYEPVFQGRRLGYWLKIEARAGTNLDNRIAAEAAFREMDTNAVPFLIAGLESDAIWASRKLRCNALVEKWHLPANLKFTVAFHYSASARVLPYLGKSAAPGLLRVFEEYSNTNVLNLAAQTLYECEGLTDGGNAGRAFANLPYHYPLTWGQYVNDQKAAISPVAWLRLSSAHVSEYRR